MKISRTLYRTLYSLSAAGLCVVSPLATAGGIQTLDTVEVLGRQTDLVGTADSANQGTVSRAQLENRPVLRPGEVLETVPGVIVTQHSGAGKANQFYLRGFNLDHGTDFATYVNGMPVNMPTHAHGQGYTDLNFLVPELISRVQYKKGPYYADEGDFSAAGVARIDYVNSLDRSLAELGVGSFGYRRGLLAGSPAVGAGHLLYGIEVFHNDGPWDVPEDYQKLNTVLRYSQGTRDNGFALTGMLYRGDWTATDQIPRRAIEQGSIGRFGTLDSTDGGDSHRYSLSGEWARRGDGATTRANAYVVDYALDLFSNFTYFLDDPVNGDQFQQADERTIYGFNVGQSRFGKLLGRDTEHSYGLQVRRDQIDEVALRSTRARQLLSTTREDEVEQTGAGVYYQNLLVWNEKFRTIAGVRADYYNAEVSSDNPANTGSRSDHITSPKLSLIFGPWAKTEYYVNVGRGFHSNDARGATTTIDPGSGMATEPVNPLVRATGSEVGVRSAIVPRLQTALSLWRLDIDSELIFVGDAGTTEASRPSRRTGVEWANYWTPLDWLMIDADFAFTRARFTDIDPVGNRIPLAVERTASIGVVFDNLGPWSGGVRLRYYGPRPLIEDNSVRGNSSTLVNANAGYEIGKDVKLTFEVFNLADVEVSDIEYFYESRLPGEAASVEDVHFHPAEPRSYRFSVSYRF